MTAYPPLHPSNANFIDIRANNGLYVDKTQHFQHLLAVFPPTGATQPDLVNKHQFLVRPRRFGKTLLINTLEAWFQGLPPAPAARLPGGRDTLTGLPDGWRAPDWMWTGLDGSDWHGVHGWHPVVKLDMSRGAAGTPAGTGQILRSYLWQTAGLWHDRGLIWDTGAPGVPGPDADPASLLTYLLRRLDQAYGARPVVLVDEYDAALTEHLGSDADPTPAAAALRRFYRVLKDDEGLLYGVFVTGITRLARQHLFSAANNFTDISSDEPCADLCGFTEEEVKECLAPHRDALRELEPRLDEDRMLDDWRDMYNGYRFARSSDVDQVYNPYTLTNGLRWTLANTEARLDAVQGLWPSEWSKTGHPALTVRIALDDRRQLPPGVREGHGPPLPADGLRSLRHPDFASLMYDTGYYTWCGGCDGAKSYLGFPNREVSESWMEDILDLWNGDDRPVAVGLADNLRACLWDGDVDGFAQVLQTFHDGIAGDNLINEACFRAVLQTLCRMASDDVQAEKSTWGGRADLEVGIGNRIYVIEVKRNRSASEALNQIRDRPYGREHLSGKRSVVAIGLAFRKDENGVRVECRHRHAA